MCLYKKGDFKIANEPIECYKVMKYAEGNDKNRIISLYHNSLYIDTRSGYVAGDYIKAGKKLSRFKHVNRKKINNLTELNGEVVHSYIKPPMAPNWGNVVFVRCEIPMNEVFWVGNQSFFDRNEIEEYGSLSLQIKEIIKDEWRIKFKFKHRPVITYKIPSLVKLDDVIKMSEDKSVIFPQDITGFEIYRHNTETYKIEKVYSTICVFTKN